jgi:hypothetical protein
MINVRIMFYSLPDLLLDHMNPVVQPCVTADTTGYEHVLEGHRQEYLSRSIIHVPLGLIWGHDL